MQTTTRLISLPRMLFDLLPRRERWELGGVSIVVVIATGFETLGVASILPFMAMVVDPSTLDRHPRLASVATLLGAQSPPEIMLVAAAVTGALIALANAAGACNLWLQVRTAARMRHRLATSMFRAFLRQPYVFHTTRDTASLIKVVEQDVDNVIDYVLTPMLSAASRVLIVVALLVLVSIRSPFVALVGITALGGAYLVVYSIVRQRQVRLGEVSSQAAGEWQRSAYEAFGGIKDLIVFGRAERIGTRFAAGYKRFIDAEAGNIVTSSMPRFVLETVAFGCIIALTLALLLGQNAQPSYTIPALALYAFVAYRLLPGLQQLFASAATLRFGAASLQTLHEEWHRVGAGNDAAVVGDASSELGFSRSIALDGVSFAYPHAAHPTLTDVTFHIKRGECVGFIGKSGAGKSTLADVLLGLLEPSAGSVSIDGVVLMPERRRAWLRRIGYVPQHIFLANASVAENIAFGLDTSELDGQAVERAARRAQIHEFVMALPNQYATLVGERGVRLSGGERQRIGIARALYHEPDVLVLDEATSALDGLTEAAVMSAIHQLSGERTIIIIAHRVQTLASCDRIGLIDAGRLVASGTLAELNASSSAFAQFTAHS